MKTQSAVLFTVICLFACCTHRQTLPVVVKTEDKKVNDGPSWPSLEYNRAAMVFVEYRVLENTLGHPIVRNYFIDGVVVAPRTIISDQFVNNIGRLWVYNVQSITIRSVSGDWSGIPAVIVAETGRAQYSLGDVVLLFASADLPNTRPAVFGELPPYTYRQKAEGYYFETDKSVLPRYNMKKTTPAFVKFSDDGEECFPADQSDPNSSSAGFITFDRKHRLVCVSWTSSAKVKRLLRANNISFLEK